MFFIKSKKKKIKQNIEKHIEDHKKIKKICDKFNPLTRKKHKKEMEKLADSYEKYIRLNRELFAIEKEKKDLVAKYKSR